MKILFAWDFHGVLEKDNDLAVKEICDRVLKDKGIKNSISLDKVRELYGLRWYDYYQFLAPSAGHEELMEMVETSIKMSGELTKNFLKANDFALNVLKEIKEKNHFNIVISNSCPVRINDFVSWVGLKPFFAAVIGIDKHRKDISFDLVGEKAKVIKAEAQKIDAEKIVVIGDREEDILAGLESGAITFLYKGPLSGHSGETKAHYVINDLREVLKNVLI